MESYRIAWRNFSTHTTGHTGLIADEETVKKWLKELEEGENNRNIAHWIQNEESEVSILIEGRKLQSANFAHYFSSQER